MDLSEIYQDYYDGHPPAKKLFLQLAKRNRALQSTNAIRFSDVALLLASELVKANSSEVSRAIPIL